MRYLKHMNPAEGASDLWSFIKQPTPYRWWILAFSIAVPGSLLYIASQHKIYGPPDRPTVTYITSFEPGRSDEEILREGEEHERWKEQYAGRLEERAKLRKQLYGTLGRSVGFDVDKMEREIAEGEAAEQAIQDSRRQRLLERQQEMGVSIDDSGRILPAGDRTGQAKSNAADTAASASGAGSGDGTKAPSADSTARQQPAGR